MSDEIGVSTAPYELSSSQMNIWNAERAYSGTSINTICATIRINGTFDIAAIQKSMDAVIREDAQLRTRITLVNGSPCQYTAPYEHALFPVFDFTGTDREGLAHWESAVTREVMPILDAPLFDLRIFKQNESEGGIIVKTHHIISDGWSQMLLSNRIAETYFALISGSSTVHDEAAPPSYRLHINKEKAYLLSPARERDESYWRERLSLFDGASAVKDCLSAAVSPVGRRKTYRLSHVLNHAIHDFCEKYRVAPFAVYYMALAVFLQRAGGGRRSAIGVPVFNRADFTDKNTLGMFVSTLPFIGEIDENWSFAQFNRELAEQWFELLRHQRLPFSKINAIGRELAPDAGSLFHIVLSYQTSRIYKSADAAVTFSGRWHYSGYQAEHLLIHLSSMEDDFRFSVDYDYLTQIFSEQDIDRLHGYLTEILTAALAEPETPVWKLPVTDIGEKERVLFAFNQTARPLSFNDVPSMLTSAAGANAQRVAIICGGRRLTYEGLMALAGSYARAMDSVCPEAGRVIVICLDKGFPLAAAVTAAAISGNTWLTLPSDTPPGRLNEIIEDCNAAMLICDEKKAPPGCRSAVMSPTECERFPAGNYAPKPPAETAYIVYTSGSTGRPKGVMIGQKSLVNLALALKKLYGHGAVLSLCSAGFDVFVMECAASLMNGRTIVFPTRDEQEDPERLASLIRDYAVGNMALPPSRLEAYIKNASFARALAVVEKIVCGGEHFPGELMQALRQYTDASVYNQYGPSETTVAVSWKLLNDARAITVGAPMDNCRLYVLDTHLQPLPVGIYGEVYIGGVCVGQGYVNRPELTEKAFIKSPFEQRETLYRTGDTGCWTDSGEIMLGGRMDSQVKLRGLRIEPQEIAMRIAAHGAVDSAAVKIIRNGRSALIVAYYTSRTGVGEAELAAFAGSFLPGYMLPGAYIRMDELPVTRSGKIDTSALPDPVITTGGEAENDAEGAILGIFRTTLKKPDMGVESDYFLCGGDSLTAMEAIAAIEAALGVKPSVADIYALRSARRLASSLTGCDIPAGRPFKIEKAPAKASYPATPTQLSLYFESASAPGSTAYNMPGAFRLPKGCDRAALTASLRELIRRESILRTAFEITGEGVVQRVYDNAPLGIPTLTADSFDAAAKAFVRPFDISRAPLMRAAFWASPDGEDYLFFDTHHLIGDGLTAPLLMNKLDRVYNGLPDGDGIRFSDYAYWAASQKADAASLSYWKEALADMPPLPDIPFDRKGEAAFPAKGEKLIFSPDAETVRAVNDYTGDGAVSPFMLFLSAFAAFMMKLTGACDMTVGTPVAGRTRPELFDVCGPFIHALPVRLKLRPDMSAKELIEAVKRETLRVMDAQDAPLEELMKLAHGDKGGALFNTLFTLRPVGDKDFSFMGETLHPIPIDTGEVKFPLSIEAASGPDGWSFTLEYASGLIDADSAALWARSYAAVLLDMLKRPGAALSDIDAVSPADRFALFERADRVRAPFADIPLDMTVLDSLDRRGDEAALVFHEKSMSGKALATRAREIARGLISLGVKPGDTVGVVLQRNPGLIAALVGILAAGAAYMPSLPSFPAARTAEMAGIAKARLILTDDKLKLGLADMPCPVAALSELKAGDAALPSMNDRREAPGMYVLFTSGTTGKPKAALVTHTAIANLSCDMERVLSDAQNVLCATSAVFDIFTTESLIALALGKTVILADEEEMLLPHALASLISNATAPVHAMQLTPSRLKAYMLSAPFSSALADIRVMLTAGEALSPALANGYFSCTKGRLYNLYGPTEASVYATFTECERGSARITIGKPVTNCRCYILDETGRRVMPTARGEAYIAGVCVSRGYVNAPELNQKCFIPDPFFPGDIMYKSGDGARLLPDGNIEYLGRLDSQLKLNGQRVEPLEIANRIERREDVSSAAVVPVKAANGETRLRACIVRAAGCCVAGDEILSALRAELPPYMIPSEVVFLERFPETASGKTDMRALASMDMHAVQEHVPAAKAHSGTEETLAAIWRNALSRESIYPDVSFFEQGGGSLAAIDAISRMYGAGIKLTISEFYANPTLKAQAALIDAQGRRADEAEPEAALTPRAAAGGSDMPERDAILLTGATGFLGAHILNELAANMKRRVVCIIRGGDIERLGAVMEGYFHRGWLDENRARVSAVAGDMQSPMFGIPEDTLASLSSRAGMLVHCAADVRHYSSDEEASVRANAGGTANAVKLAARLNARLAYISTMSVAGDGRRSIFTEADPPADPAAEKNVYVRGKCAAELIVRRCAHMLPGTAILRIGRLVGRDSDGVFQRNKAANAFYTFIRGALMLDEYPESACDMPLELTPVDECARAVTLLLQSFEQGAQNGPDTVTYHVFDTVRTGFGELMHTLGKRASFVPDGEFEAYLMGLTAMRPCAELVMVNEMWALARGAGAGDADASGAVSTLRSRGFIWKRADIKTALREYTD